MEIAVPTQGRVSVNNNNNDNNKRICIAQVCRMTSEALGGQLQLCYSLRLELGLKV